MIYALKPDRGWVGEWLAQYPDNYEVVNTLAHQIKDIWKNNQHHKDGGEPYKLAQRLAMLAHEIDAVPARNCKSGKDRTGMMDSEIKREIISFHQTHMLNAPAVFRIAVDRKFSKSITE